MINIFASKFLEDINVLKLISGWGSYVQHGATQQDAPKIGKNARFEKAASSSHFEAASATATARQRTKQPIYTGAACGARAGYLVGCALTSSIDLIAGTPKSSSGQKTKHNVDTTAPRALLGVLRSKPTFSRVEAQHDGLLGRAYYGVSAVLQWAAGNIAALVGVCGFALVHGISRGVQWLCGLGRDAREWELKTEKKPSFRSRIETVAQASDAVGSAVVAVPLYLTFGVIIGGAMVSSGTLKGACAGAGALCGATFGLGQAILNYDWHLTRDIVRVVDTARTHVASSWTDAVDALDSRTGLRRAKQAAAKRVFAPDDVIEELVLSHHEDAWG